jgi:hypothetical protein
MSRLDAMVVREKDGKSYWTKIGVAFEGRDGKWVVRLDATPLDGVIHLMPPRERRDERPVPRQEPDDDLYPEDGVGPAPF